MQLRMLLASLVVVGSLVGCGAVGDDPVEVTPPAQTDALKAALNDVAQTGQVGSGGMIIEQEIENLRSSDPAKADALKKGFDDLQRARDPNAAKAKAQEMMSNL